MATAYDHITDKQADLIKRAALFFIASADPSLHRGPLNAGPVNLSPKGDSRLTVLDANKVAYFDYTGSGNETARHARAGGPVTVMVCSFDASDAAIVRLYGTATVFAEDEYPHLDQIAAEAAGEIALPGRQVIEITVKSTVTSCGYGVPVAQEFRARTRDDRGRRFK
jgi:hypothetical protein